MIVSLIAAMASNRVIGRNNDLPWQLPDDMKYFMQTTTGHHCIMGRKNYDSIPAKYKPLPHRTNLVVTRQKDLHAPGCTVVGSIEEALKIAAGSGETEAFVIGGAEIYQLGLPHAHRIYLTEIAAAIPGDTCFPAFDHTVWQETSRKHHAADARHAFAFDFVVYEKK